MSQEKDTKAKGIDYDELVEVDIPEDFTGKKSKTVIISVNGKKLELERGKTHKIPRKYKIMLDEKKILRKTGERYKAKHTLTA